jgi:hypothetical protein
VNGSNNWERGRLNCGLQLLQRGLAHWTIELFDITARAKQVAGRNDQDDSYARGSLRALDRRGQFNSHSMAERVDRRVVDLNPCDKPCLFEGSDWGPIHDLSDLHLKLKNTKKGRQGDLLL